MTGLRRPSSPVHLPDRDVACSSVHRLLVRPTTSSPSRLWTSRHGSSWPLLPLPPSSSKLPLWGIFLLPKTSLPSGARPTPWWGGEASIGGFVMPLEEEEAFLASLEAGEGGALGEGGVGGFGTWGGGFPQAGGA